MLRIIWILLLLPYMTEATVLWKDNEVIVKFKDSERAVLESNIQERYVGNVLVREGMETGIREVDDLNREFRAEEIRRLIVGKVTDKAKSFGLDLIYIVKFNGAVDVPSIVERYNELESVEYAEPNLLRVVDTIPNDPYVGTDYWTEQWYLFQIDATRGWDVTQGDSGIVVGPVDTGVDWDHPDIYDKLWVNPGEDTNGNGKFDYPDDINGIDDDGNGYTDDVIGFDFSDNDWDPTPHPTAEGAGHGTHVYGIAVAATNNALGVAGVGWNVKGMAFKCDVIIGDVAYISISAAVNAIYYAANNGAVATNHSYGGSYSSSENTAMQYAHDTMNVTISASAGNENNPSALYPARYNDVIGVAATGPGDIKASFSKYGTGVDVAAPGTHIYSTIPGGNYAGWDGTSMSSPMVAGLAGLIRSLHPSWTSYQVDSAIFFGADNIDTLNPGYEGLLGWGRINVRNSLLLGDHSYLRIVDYWFDGDGRPDAGEIVKMFLDVFNRPHWQDASGVELRLRVEDPLIQVTDSLISISSIPNGDTVSSGADYFQFEVDPSFEPGYVPFIINYTASPPSADEEETLSVLIGYPDIILVDDASNSSIREIYKMVLDTLGVVYELYNVDQSGGLMSFVSPPRTTVIWFTGNDSAEVLSPDEIDSLTKFLSSGGNLFISSQYLVEDSIDSKSFMENYLKSDLMNIDVPYQMMSGEEGDTIGDSLFIRLNGPGGAANSYSPDEIMPLSGADSVFYYTDMAGNGNYGIGGVRYDSGVYKSIFLPFAFESISDETPGKNTKMDVMYRILNWFGVPVSIDENEPSSSRLSSDNFLVSPTIISKNFRIEFTLSKNGPVQIDLFDVSGRKIKVLYSGVVKKGFHRMQFNSLTSLSSGVYFVRLKIQQYTSKVKKITKF